MTPPLDDSSPPRPCSKPKDTLIKFASLLGTFRLQKAAEKPGTTLESVFVPNNNALAKLFEEESSGIPLASFPSLSLMTLVGEAHMESDTDKEVVEAHAVANLARHIVVRDGGNTQVQYRFKEADQQKNSTFSLEPFFTDDLRKVPNMILDNVAASFSVLVEARLRAYLALLARHGVSISNSPDLPEEEKDDAINAVEHKLACLLNIGTNVSIDNLVTNFGASGKLDFPSRSSGQMSVSTPLGMAVGLDMSIPRLAPSGGSQRLAIAVKTGGFITGTFREDSNLLSSVEVELDTRRLLTVMKHEAARVISIALEHANEVSALLHPLAPSSSPRVALQGCLGQKRAVRIPDGAAELSGPEVPVVSPDLKALLATREECAALPTLRLADPDKPTEVSSDLSPASCANIVDCVMEEVGACCFLPKRPSKKMKFTARPAVS